MRTDRRGWWIALGLAGVVVATGCSAGKSPVRTEAGVARPAAPDGPATTTTAPPVVTTPPATTPRVTDTTAPRRPIADPAGSRPDVAGGGVGKEPVYVDGVPQVRLTPSRAPVGASVEVEGYGFTGEPWQTAGGPLWLSGTTDCGLFAPAEHDLRVSGDGHLTGRFIVPEKGECRFQEAPGEVSLAGGRFHLAFQCTACQIGTFTVILDGESMEEPTGTECAPINFGGGENVAAEVFAEGLPCAEAESFIRDNAGPWGPDQGPFQVSADGFSCQRTGSSDRFLPRANYKCTRGAETIWFNRT